MALPESGGLQPTQPPAVACTPVA